MADILELLRQPTSPMAGKTPGPLQLAIMEKFCVENQSILVQATAGSSKTTSLSAIAWLHKQLYPRDPIIYLVFNRHNRKEADDKFGHLVTVKTTYSIGWKYVNDALRAKHIKLKNVDDNKYKYLKIMDELLKDRGGNKQEFDEMKWEFSGWLDIMRLTRTPMNDPQRLYEVSAQYSLFPEEWMIELAPTIMAIGHDRLMNLGEMSYTDMIAAPLELGLQTKPEPWRCLLVDEAQDLSEAQTQIVQSLSTPGYTKWAVVGDPDQSMYAFTGANFRAYDNLGQISGGVPMPLSVSYRLPRRHIALAKLFSERIEAAPNAIEGEIECITTQKLMEMAAPGDLILGRFNVTLIKYAYKLITSGKAATIRGRDFGKRLVNFLDKAIKYYSTANNMPEMMISFAALPKAIDTYCFLQESKLAAKPYAQDQIEILNDQKTSLMAFWEQHANTYPELVKNAKNSLGLDDNADDQSGVPHVGQLDFTADIQGFRRAIEDLFSDDSRKIELSSIHRAKGSEATRVFLLDVDKLPWQKKEMTAEQMKQERNVTFVALTRSRFYLGAVIDKKEPETLLEMAFAAAAKIGQ